MGNGLSTIPQSLHPYAYAFNNPVNLTDPSGEIAPILIAIGIGALIGGGHSYGSQVWHNYQQGMTGWDLWSQVCWSDVLVSALIGGFAGGVGYAVFTPVLWGIGYVTGINVAVASWASVGASMVAGAITGQIVRVSVNMIAQRPLGEGLGNPIEIAVDAVFSGIVPAGQVSRGRISAFVRARIARNMNQAIEGLVEDNSFLSSSPALQGTKIHAKTARLMRAENIPGLDIEAKLSNPNGGRDVRLDYWFRPENIVYDIKPEGTAFPRSVDYGQLTEGNVNTIRYRPYWRR